jgi:hypothetical protein
MSAQHRFRVRGQTLVERPEAPLLVVVTPTAVGIHSGEHLAQRRLGHVLPAELQPGRLLDALPPDPRRSMHALV